MALQIAKPSYESGVLIPAPVSIKTKTEYVVSSGFKIKAPSKPDGKHVERAAFEWIDARCNADEYVRLTLCGLKAGLGFETMKAYREFRGITGYLNVVIDGKQVDGSAFTEKSLIGWAVLKFNFDHLGVICTAPPADQSVFTFFSGDEYAADFIGGPELVEDVLPAIGTAMIYGESGSGKTFWALDLAFHVHNGAPWRDKDVAGGNAFYVAAEAGRSVKKRIQGVKALNPQWKAPYVADMAPNLSSAESMAAIRAAIGDTQASVVIIDTLSASFEGDDSSQQDAAVVIRNLKRLSEDLNCLVVFVHHTRKDGGSFRGSGVLKNDVDAVLEITTEGDDQFRVHCARVEKNRDGEQGARYAFRLLKSEPLAYKPNGKAVTTCTVEHTDDVTGAALKLPKAVQMLKDVYDEADPGISGMTLSALLSAAKTKYGDKYRTDNAKAALSKHTGGVKLSDTQLIFL